VATSHGQSLSRKFPDKKIFFGHLTSRMVSELPLTYGQKFPNTNLAFGPQMSLTSCHRRSILVLINILKGTHFLSRCRNCKKQLPSRHVHFLLNRCLFRLKFYRKCNICISLCLEFEDIEKSNLTSKLFL
jgi:hypothetical protein